MGKQKKSVNVLRFRMATVADAAVLGAMNRQMILDEKNRNTMTVPQLIERMAGRIAPGHEEGYAAAVFELGGAAIGYVLFKRLPEYVYIQQFYVRAENRRQGIGRAALAWLQENPWKGVQKLQLDVLVTNAAGAAFWHNVGFKDYCTTMEMELQGRSPVAAFR